MTTTSNFLRTETPFTSPLTATGLRAGGALRLDPKTKPLSAPFPMKHCRGSQRIYSGISESNDMQVNVSKDRMVTNRDEFHSDIWMMELEPGK
jgi:hypothetical protein